MEFKKREFYGLLIQGDLHGAVDYLAPFPEQQELLERYQAVFNRGEVLRRSDNMLVNQVDAVFQSYYRAVFWQKAPDREARSALAADLARLAGLTLAPAAPLDERLDCAEQRVAELVEAEGFHYLGGETSGWFGPYIWKTNETTVYQVELPRDQIEVPVTMMKEFVSRSWLDFLSFGQVGTGGWTKEDGLYCVWKAYKENLNTPSFQITFLKHEGQHKLDMTQYGVTDSTLLEYRAKLVELIYYPDLTTLQGFLAEANGNNSKNAHAMAAYQIVTELTRRLFGVAEVPPLAWEGKEDAVRNAARTLYEESYQSR